ncbi:MAG: immunoglobulin-like domain-containing protein [Eubacterium sp.]
MKNASRIITAAAGVLCIAVLVYLIFFFGSSSKPEETVVTEKQKEYTISFESEQLEYTKGTDFMEGVSATDENGTDLTREVTVSCKPTKNIKTKTLTYSVNKPGYSINTFERTLVITENYSGPSVTVENVAFEIPIDRIGSLSAEAAKSGIIDTDDGFGGKCSVTVQINAADIAVGDYAATVTAQNLFGDTASAKMIVTVTDAESSVIKLKASSVSLAQGDSFEPMEYVEKAEFGEYGDITGYVTASGNVDTSKPGVYTVEYKIKGIEELKNETAYLYVTVK